MFSETTPRRLRDETVLPVLNEWLMTYLRVLEKAMLHSMVVDLEFQPPHESAYTCVTPQMQYPNLVVQVLRPSSRLSLGGCRHRHRSGSMSVAAEEHPVCVDQQVSLSALENLSNHTAETCGAVHIELRSST
jgi:hypothetical protein